MTQVMFFSATTAANGRELWITDGTPEGTRLVKDIIPGTGTAFPDPVRSVNGVLLFGADDPTHDYELFTTDGTEAGTRQFLEINPTGSASPNGFFALENGAVFFANDGATGKELWFTDGTEAGTRLLADIQPGSTGSSASALSVIKSGDKVFFTPTTSDKGAELWVIESVAAGPHLVTEIVSGATGGSISVLTPFKNGVFFYANDGVAGVEPWVSDGTAAGTFRLGDFSPGTLSAATDPTIVGDKIFFGARLPLTSSFLDGQLWVSDGTVAGTTKVLENISWPINTVGAINGKAIFTANDQIHGTELWVSDGTAAGTSLLKDIKPGGINDSGAVGASRGIVYNGELYFKGTTTAEGAELWKTDGTPEGTVLVKDINTGTGNGLSGVLNAQVFNGKLYFQATNGVGGGELWVTDGTAAGTSLVMDINPGSASSSPTAFSIQTVPDPVVSISLTPASDEEGSGFTLTATRTGAMLTQPTTITYTITGDSANAGDISTPLTGTITIPANATSATLSIDTVEDAVFEPNETFTVTASSPVNGTIGTGTASATIINDDAPPPPTLSISATDASKAEGDGGATLFTFTVTRTGDLSQASSVDYNVTGLGVPPADVYDFAAGVLPSGTVSFAAGEASATLAIEVAGDALVEGDEMFAVVLTNPVGATLPLGVASAAGTILNDDVAPVAGSVSVSDVTITEGDAGTKVATFTLTRTGGTAAFDVDYATADGTASAGSDYVATSGKASFAAGADAATVSVTIDGDTTFETDETFALKLTNATAGATISNDAATGTITNDDAAPLPLVSIAITPSQAEEGNAFTLTAIRSGVDLSQPTTITYALTGSAANSSDISTPLTGTITIAAGQTTSTLSIATVEDAVFEPNETFSVTASNPVNGAIAVGVATGTIFNDDVAPGKNIIIGTACREVIKGTNGGDAITALAGNDRVYAKGGDDCIVATKYDGCDFYHGGAGNDTVDYSALKSGITAKLFDGCGGAKGIVKGRQSGTDTLVSIENVVGTQAADKITGNKYANVIEGGGGNDKLAGGAGSDTFVFKPGFGRDVISDFAATGRQHDVIEISTSLFADWSAVEAALVDGAKGAVLHVDDANSITFTGVTKAEIVANHVDDFRFV